MTNTAVLIVLVSLLLGLATALVADKLSTRLRNEYEVRAVSELPLLGRVIKSSRDNNQLDSWDRGGPEIESYESLRAALRYTLKPQQSHSLVVASATAGEGKSTVLINLARVLAAAGVKVAIVDADLRKPRIAEYLALDSAIGLSDVLIGAHSVQEVSQPWGATGRLTVVVAGATPPNPGQLVQSDEMRHLIADLKTRHELILVDAPPILPVSDAAVVGRDTDGVLLIAALGQVRRGELIRSLEEFERLNTTVLGLVLNKVPTRGVDSFHRSYEYLDKETAPQDRNLNAPRSVRVSERFD